MVRDFLPVCDLLLYFINAATPLDDADLPLLKMKQQYLRFLPTRFVITRTDEFREDRTRQLSDSNISKALQDGFSQDLLRRINDTIGDSSVGNEDLLFIDNISDFRLQALNEMIALYGAEATVSRLLETHSHKIDYFRGAAIRLRDFFLTQISERRVSSEGVVSNSRKNVKKWEDVVQITNNRQTERWHEHFVKVRGIPAAMSIELNSLLRTFMIQGSFRQIFAISGWAQEIATTMKGESEAYANRLIQSVVQSMLYQLRRALADLREKLDQIKTIDDIQVAAVLPDTPAFGWKDNEQREAPHFLLSDAINKRPKLFDGVLSDLDRTIRGAISSLQSVITSRRPIPEFNQIIEEARTELTADIDRYFSQVEVYVTAVNSGGQKALTEKLRMGATLDEVEKAVGEQERREQLKKEASDLLFPGFVVAKSAFVEGNEKLLSSLEALIGAFPRALIEPSSNTSTEWPKVWDDTRRELGAHIELRIRERWRVKRDELSARIQELVTAAMEKRKQKLELLTKKMWTSVGIATAIFALIGLIASVSVVYFNFVNPPTVIWQVALNVAASIVCGTAGFFWKKIQFAYPLKSERNVSSILTDLKADIGAILDSATEQVGQTSELLAESKNVVLNKWREYLDKTFDDSLSKDCGNRYVELLSLKGRFEKIRETYLNGLNKFFEVVGSYFADSDANLKKLGVVSAKLKDTVIEPCDRLFQEQHKCLADSEQELAGVRME